MKYSFYSVIGFQQKPYCLEQYDNILNMFYLLHSYTIKVEKPKLLHILSVVIYQQYSNIFKPIDSRSMPISFNFITSTYYIPRKNARHIKTFVPRAFYTASRVAGNIWMRTFYLCRYTLPAKHSFYNDCKQTCQFVHFHPNRNKNTTVHGYF